MAERQSMTKPVVDSSARGVGRLIDGDESYTYRELHDHANRLARLLVERGIGPDDVVAIAVPRSAEMVTAVLGVLKAGAAYLPLDLDYPAERLRFMFDDARPDLLLGTADGACRLPGGVPAVLLDDPSVRAGLDGQPAHDLTDDDRVRPLAAGHAAYVIYTSGSTGRPKGISMSHGALAQRVQWLQETHPLTPADRVVLKTPLSFDVSAREILGTLAAGATLVVAGPDGHRDPGYLAALVKSTAATVLHFVPSMLRAFLDVADPEDIRSVRRLVCSGEALTADLRRRVFATLDAELLVSYGPAEAGLNSLFWQCRRDDPAFGAPIGRPSWNTRAYVLDGALRPVPIGVPGEVYIAGSGLARGYTGRAALTAERFVADPFWADGGRMYRSGDLACRRPDGSLSFLGRADSQVKIRGIRVEPSEVEAVLARHPAVDDAVVVASADPPGQTRLIAYVVPVPGRSPTQRELRGHLTAHLPAAMVPGVVAMLERLPRQPNGKVDRKALPAPVVESTGRQPRTPTQTALCEVFSLVLQVPGVCVDDDFFALGGHSLMAARLVGLIRAKLHVDLPLRTLFERPTPEGLAEVVDAAGGPALLPPRPRDRPDAIPLSFGQQRMWFLHRLEGLGSTYNIPIVQRITGHFDPGAFTAALADVARRHEVLRTIYPEVNGAPVQLVLPADRARPTVAIEDVDPATLSSRLRSAVEYPFDLLTEIPVRAWLFRTGQHRTGQEEHVLALVIHHIAGDGWSMMPLARDLALAYQARLEGRDPDWPGLPVQYIDYTLWQRELLDSDNGDLAYWAAALADLPKELPLPYDRPVRATTTNRGSQVRFGVPAHTHRQLARLARDTGTTVFMVCHAALTVLLAKLSGHTDIPIGTPVNGRTDQALDSLVGFFLNTLVLRVDVADDPTFGELLRRIRRVDLAAFAHQETPFERIVELLNPHRTASRNPLFQVMMPFNSNLADSGFELPGAVVRPEDALLSVAKFDLSFALREELGDGGEPLGIHGSIDYRTDLFDDRTVAAMARRLLRVVDAVLADPDVRVCDIDVLDPGERARYQVAGRVTNPAAFVHELFEAQAARVPAAVAVVCGDESVSYGELNARANRMARHLIANGVGPEDRVAVALPRSTELVVALLAVLKAGAAYVPVDPGYPSERIAVMLEAASPALVLSERVDVARLSPTDVTDTDRVAPLSPAHPAYVIFTSGSTGRPKGVVVEHRSFSAYVEHAATCYPGIPGVSLVHTSVSFDLTVTALYGQLATGGRVELGEVTAEHLTRSRSTFLKGTPSHLDLFASLPASAMPSECLMLGGEPLDGPALRAWRERNPGATLYNAYGPTETTVTCCEFRLPPDCPIPADRVPIGTPFPGVGAYVLDRRLRPVPTRVTGELYISGPGLARGYFDQPRPTATRYVADPFGPAGSRMYRTGDLVRWTPDGVLEFLGRADDQVKVRGFRMELGEIEAALRAQPGVASAATAVHRYGERDQRLIGYVVPADGQRHEAGALRLRLAEMLPDYMVPNSVVVLDRMPTGPGGKLDRAALPAPGFTVSDANRPPRTTNESLLCDLFAELLHLPLVGPDDSFFDLGGHSLLAIRLISRIEATLGPRLSIGDLFERPTPAGLGTLIEAGDSARRVDPLATVLRLRAGTRTPLFCVHPAAGLGWVYSGLSRYLPEHAVYALQAPGLGLRDASPRSVDQLVSQYLERIRMTQPTGPYALLGWSVGGVIAHLLAVALQEAGERVALLALLDSYPTAAVGAERQALTKADVAAELAASLGQKGPSDGALPGFADLPLDRMVDVFGVHRRLFAGVRPGVFDGDLLIFTATVGKPGGSPLTAALWRDYVRGNVEVVAVDCAHGQLTQPGPMSRIGPVVGGRLAEVLALAERT